MIHSYEIERQVLAGLLKLPEFYPEIASFVNEKDFFDKAKIHRVIYNVIRNLLNSNKNVDAIIVAQRIKELGISTPENVDISEYVNSLTLRKITLESAVEAARELKRLSAKRFLYYAGEELQSVMQSLPPEAPFSEIIAKADEIYNKHIDFASCEQDEPINLYDKLPDVIERLGRGEDILKGPMGPYETINKIFGSLLIPGNITTVVARAGTGKTSIALDFITKVSHETNIPCLHFDNGEMSEVELMVRQTAALSGVPMFLIQSGQWRHAGEEVVTRVRAVYEYVKNLKFYYYSVAGKTPEEMVNVLKRSYFKYVKRGERMIFSFDYIKATISGGGDDVWLNVGTMLDKFKTCIQKELVFDGVPVVAMFTSVQSNRMGIVGRRNSMQVVDDESIAALSDMIIQLSSHFFILRKKTHDEILDENGKFGTHILLCRKARSLGEDVFGFLEPVKIDDTLRDNHINLEFNNFNITEKGDLRAFVKFVENSRGHANIDDFIDPENPRPVARRTRPVAPPPTVPTEETASLPF